MECVKKSGVGAPSSLEGWVKQPPSLDSPSSSTPNEPRGHPLNALQSPARIETAPTEKVPLRVRHAAYVGVGCLSLDIQNGVGDDPLAV